MLIGWMANMPLPWMAERRVAIFFGMAGAGWGAGIAQPTIGRHCNGRSSKDARYPAHIPATAIAMTRPHPHRPDRDRVLALLLGA